MFFEAGAERNRMTELSLKHVRVIQKLHVIMCVATLFVFAPLLFALLAVVPVLLEVSPQFQLIVGKVALQAVTTRSGPQHALAEHGLILLQLRFIHCFSQQVGIHFLGCFGGGRLR